MDELGMITGRTFSLGARGYDQDEVHGFLRDLEQRLRAGEADPGSEAAKIAAGAKFTIVTLGYARGEVDDHLKHVWAMLARRAEASPAAAPSEEPVATDAGSRRVGGFLRRRPRGEPVTAPVLAAVPDTSEPEPEPEPEPADAAAQAGEPEPADAAPEVAAAEPAADADALVHAAGTADPEERYAARPGTEPLPDDGWVASAEEERAALFARALDLRIEDAVSMTRDELRAAIERARGDEPADYAGEDDAAAEAPADAPAAAAPVPEAAPKIVAAERAADGEDPMEAVAGALRRSRATLDAFEELLRGEVGELGGAVQHERANARTRCTELVEAAHREAEQLISAARAEAAEIAAAAERDAAAVRARADRYAERVRRMAERAALRGTLPGGEAEAPAASGEDAAAASEPEPETDADAEADAETETSAEGPVEAEEGPVEAEEMPVEAEEAPGEAEEVPVEAKEELVEAEEAPAAAEPSPSAEAESAEAQPATADPADPRPGFISLGRDISKLLRGR